MDIKDFSVQELEAELKIRHGRKFAPNCDFTVSKTTGNKWFGWASIGDFYYETDAYQKEENARNELRGCLLAIKEKIEEYLNKKEK